MNLNSFLSLKKTVNKSLDVSTRFADAYENNSIINNIIFYECRDGKSMTDSPYAVFKYLISNEEYKDYYHIWSINESSEQWNKVINKYQNYENVRFVERNTDEYLYYITSAKFLFNNSTFQSFFVPRKEQICINTWHGIPLKKMGYDIEKGNPAGLQNVIRNFLFSDILVSPNNHTTDMFKKSFKLSDAYEGVIAQIGYPRIDLTNLEIRQSIFDDLEEEGVRIDPLKKTILYCPTWKGSSVNRPTKELDQIAAESLLMKNKLAGKYNLLVKVHPFVYDVAKDREDLKNMLVPDYFDPNEVMSCIDLLITDYSSIFFDFLKTNRPIIFYCWDKEIYQDSRGLYIDEKDLPGPIALTVEQVINYVENIEDIEFEYSEKRSENRKKFIPYEDGESTQRLVDYIFKKVQPNKGEIISGNEKSKKSILIYLGGMKNNGITSSAINLLKNIDYKKYDVTCFTGYPRSKEEISNILSIPKEARFIYKPGYAILNNLEQNLLRKFNKCVTEKTAKDIPWMGLQREANRVFSNREFDIAIDFSGYSFFWAKYILSVKAKRKICFLHSDMIADQNREVNGKKIHEKNLLSLFYNYSKFDKLLTVSPIMKEINQEALKGFVSKEKIGYSLNTLDIEKIFNADHDIENKNLIFKELKVDLMSLKNEISIFYQWDSTESRRKVIDENDSIRAIMSAEFKDKVRYKILINDIYTGWVDSCDMTKRFYKVKNIKTVSFYGYINNNSKHFIWIDLPTSELARIACKINEYKYFMVEINKVVELENGQIYYQISRDDTVLGWIIQKGITTVKNNILIRKIKNRYSNRNRQKNWNHRILETVIEDGFVSINTFPERDTWSRSIMFKNNRLEESCYLGKKYKYSMKVYTQDGWYFRLWDANSFVGWFSERDVLLIEKQKIIFSEEIDSEIFLKELVIYEDLYSSIPKKTDRQRYRVVKKLTTTNGVFYKTTDSCYIFSDNIQDINNLGQTDINGKLISINEDFYNIVTMGRLSPEKRQKELIEAFELVNKNYKNVRLYVLGDGPLREELTAMIADKGLNNHVFLLGHQDKPFQMLKHCQLFTLTSAYEGQPMVLLEAMAVGVPVAATNIPATQYVLKYGEYGLLAKENSVEGIASMLENAYVNKLSPANFDAIKYNERAIQMFYSEIEGDVI